MPLNTSLIKEFIILVAGPLYQVFASIILIKIMPLDKNIIMLYHYGILFFNLLPIYPLDGGKIVNIFLSIFIPYRLSLKISIYISYLSLLIVILIKRSLTINIIVMTVLSIILITKEKQKINHIYNKFILERYLNNYNFKKTCIIKNINNFYRNKRHLIKDRGNYYLENEYLAKKYQKFTEKRWLLKKCYAIINLSLMKETNMGH